MKKETECLTCGMAVVGNRSHVCRIYKHNENFYRHCGNQWSNVRPVSNDECPGCHQNVAPIRPGDTALSAVAIELPPAKPLVTRKRPAVRTVLGMILVLFVCVVAFRAMKPQIPSRAAAGLFVSLGGIVAWGLKRQSQARVKEEVRTRS